MQLPSSTPSSALSSFTTEDFFSLYYVSLWDYVGLLTEYSSMYIHKSRHVGFSAEYSSHISHKSGPFA